MRAIFLRLLAAIYFIAFASWYVQIPGLIGSQGILPAASFLLRVRQQIGARAYFLLPTLAWLHPSDSLIRGLAAAGIGISLLAVLGIALGPCMLLLWALYLSQVVVGGDFMAFQWDVLLLETGFLAIFFAPWTLRLTRLKSTDEPSHVMVWLFRWLLFRLMLLSGAVKLLSSDASWHKLTALEYHFYTQPLPNVVAWYAASLPAAFLKGCTAAMFAVELGVPFLIFLPRRPRRLAAIILIVFQALILATGNYTFFNLLAMALCVTLVEDVPPASGRPRVSAGGRRYVIGAVAAVILWVSCAQLVRTFAGRSPESGDPITSTLAPFYIANTYGLFAVMTTMRVEIIMQGSDDGQTWKDYEFKYKPGDPKRTPPWVAPHQPRLDWQMWFAALSNYRANPWFINFAYRLLQGSPDVLRLLKTNPFPEHPPYYVRALAYEYTFTSSSERRATGAWWNRKPLGSYLPPVSLKSFHQ